MMTVQALHSRLCTMINTGHGTELIQFSSPDNLVFDVKDVVVAEYRETPPQAVIILGEYVPNQSVGVDMATLGGDVTTEIVGSSCERCKGTGQDPCLTFGHTRNYTTPCADCNGTGRQQEN